MTSHASLSSMQPLTSRRRASLPTRIKDINPPTREPSSFLIKHPNNTAQSQTPLTINSSSSFNSKTTLKMSKPFKTVRVPVHSNTELPEGSEIVDGPGTNLQDRSRNSPPRQTQSSKSSNPNIEFEVGDNVEYKPIGGPNSNTSVSTGRIERVLTEKTPAGDTKVNVNATEEKPKYEIKNNNTGKKSALSGANIMGTLD